MPKRWFCVTIVATLIGAGCGSEPEPAANKDLAETAAVADAAQDPTPPTPEPGRSETLVLAAPAADGLPEVRYYSLTGG